MGLNYHAIQTANVGVTEIIRLQVKLTFHKLCLFRHSFTLTGCFLRIFKCFSEVCRWKPKGVNKMEMNSRVAPFISLLHFINKETLMWSIWEE